jgi:hypothetical protein
MAVPGAGTAVERRDADEGGELSAVEAAEVRKFGDEGSGGHRSDAGNGREQVFRFAPRGGGANNGVDVGVDGGEFLFEESLDKAPKSMQPNAHKDRARSGCRRAGARGGSGDDDFVEKYAPKYDKAVECLIKAWQTLLTFLDRVARRARPLNE